MKRCFNAVIAATLAASLAVPLPVAFADGAEGDATGGTAQATGTTKGDAGEAQAVSDQVSPLLVTEVVTDSPGKGKYTYVEVYNNSDNPHQLQRLRVLLLLRGRHGHREGVQLLR